MRAPADSPRVMFPPPLLYMPALIGGILLDNQWPLRLPRFPGSEALGAIFWVGFLFLVFPSLVRFSRSGTSPLPFRPASHLVTTGAYRFTRNPMYLGFALATIGAALTFETLWPLLLLPPTLYAVQVLVIAREEQYLARRFGAEYEAYRRRVRRWL